MPETAANRADLMTAGLNLIQQALTIYDKSLRLVHSNRRFQDMFDLPAHLVTPGAEFRDTIHHLVTRGEYGEVADVAQFVQDRVDQALDFAPHYMERTRANGRTISVEGAPLPQGGWVAVYTDITQVKRQEAMLRGRSEELSAELLSHAEELAAANRQLAATNAALQEAKRELTETEARIRLTTEMMPAHIAHIGADRRYTYSNRRLNTVMPGRPADILGRHISEALGTHAYAVIQPHLDRAFGGQASVFEFTDELSQRRIRAAFTPDRREGGDGGLYILSMDVTEETQARAALQQTRKRELAAQLTSGLAHDFSNLLTIILGMQGRLQRMDLPGEASDLIAATLNAARRGGVLLNRIADMTGTRDMAQVPLELGDFLADLELLAGASLPEGITLTIRNDAPPGPVLADPGMLQDSLLNLVLNARDACGTEGRIKLTVSPVQDTWLDFLVTDTGPGFTPQALARGLDPFFTTKGEEGSGLGLAMVYDMTKLAGGEVRLTNGYIGARVTLRLPYRPVAPQAAAGLVLLVEDNADLRSTVRDMLTAIGHTVIEAGSVPEAQAVAEGLPDIALILSDLQLGPETGLVLAESPACAGKPLYFMTSLPASHDLRRSAAALAPVIAKPFTAAALDAFLHPGQPEAAQ
ncbi:PAS-domain containing protein [Mesobacterium pallidum]|uniref:hybrid sensor histidine kinase/response regulator n=1 Tax=Mesobacterium pallidum TaxID=2872037 RepID=UPI001EE23527|nr:PAS-domain containing protein [Mesobacterium pallidum]